MKKLILWGLLSFWTCLFLMGEESLLSTDALQEAARWAVGKESLTVEDQSYSLDCSGLIYAISAKAGRDITPWIRDFPGTGVARLYKLMEIRNLLQMENPLPGDLIFWDDSYDKNGNGKCDDPLTHVGMVVEVDQDGLVHFIHHNYRQGLVMATMDLEDPGNSERNSPMRARADGHTDNGGWSAGHLFRAYGRLSQLDFNED